MKAFASVIFLICITIVACSSTGSLQNTSTADGGAPSVGDASDSSSSAIPGCRSLGKSGDRCAFDADCCSGSCFSGSTCENSPLGGSCDEDGDCGVGECKNGLCKVRAVGEACTSSRPCGSGTCTDGVCACSSKIGDSCVATSDCCSGLGCYDGTCLRAKAEACAADLDCVTGACPDGKCACAPANGRCLVDGDCCSGPCTAGRCQLAPGASCTTSAACATPTFGADETCRDGKCACLDANSPCTNGGECCSDSCKNKKGYGFGMCDWSYSGAHCLSNYSCLTQGGGGYCQDDGTCECSPNKGPCRSTADCCDGGVCKVEPSSGKVQCVGGPDAKPPCVRFGQASKTGSDCCKGLISSGPGTACCGAVGYTCTEQYECCSGSCLGGSCE